jgi:DNA-binding NtrC family response regulator
MADLTALIVEDDADFRASLAALVGRAEYATREAATLEQARAAIESQPPDVVLVDLGLPDGHGLELLRAPELPPLEFIVITGNASVPTAVEALRAGALDYLTKPIDRARLEAVLANVARTRALKREIASLRGELRELGHFGAMVGRSAAMQKAYDLISRVARTDATVFLHGESGTGKELAAETIHALSRRRDRPFLSLNCGGITASLIESELFGHEKGSFTGADRRRLGYFEEASGGTLLLDEVTEMPVALQVKLLRVLETGVITRVGATEPHPVDVRVIAACNCDPRRSVEDGQLRADLFYRLNVFPIPLPPLREREGDVERLALHFLAAVNERDGTAKDFSEASLERLRRLSWPGNVRELKNVVERAAILADRSIEPELLPELGPDGTPSAADATLQVRVGSPIAEAERRLILATLEQVGGDKRRAADLLGISLKTLYNRLNVYAAETSRRRDEKP